MLIESFAFRNRAPHADVILDARRLRDPAQLWWLKRKDGRSEDVRAEIRDTPGASALIARGIRIAETLGPRVHLAIGCVAGHHRSVAIVEEIAQALREKGIPVQVRHRELRDGQTRELREVAAL